MKSRNHIDFSGYQAQNKKEHILGADPSLGASDAARTWYNSATNMFRGWDGSTAHTLTNLIESVQGSGALSAVLSGKTVNLAIAAATNAAPGTMSAGDKSKLNASTAANTPSALVQRDASGNFAAGTITASLNGLAADSTLFNGQTLAQVRDFSQTTGQRGARSAISDFDSIVRESRLDQMASPTTAVGMNNQRLATLADPVQAQDAATKNYVDSVATGLDPKQSMRFATTVALNANYANGNSGVGATLTATANGAFPVTDGVTASLDNRVLVKNQAAQIQNGFYRITDLGSASTPWVLTRTTDADQAYEVTPGMFAYIEEGTNFGKTSWVLGSIGATTMGSTALPFTQFSGAGTYLAGNGLALSGSTFSAVGTTDRISVGSSIDIAATYAGQTSITTLGTIGTGTWAGTTIAVNRGGTGATTAAGARANLGAITKYAADLPAGTTLTVTHNLGTLDVLIQVREVASGDIVFVDPKVVDANTVQIGFGDAVAAGAYRVLIIG